MEESLNHRKLRSARHDIRYKIDTYFVICTVKWDMTKPKWYDGIENTHNSGFWEFLQSFNWFDERIEED